MLQSGDLLERFLDSARAVGAGAKVIASGGAPEAICDLVSTGELVLVSPELPWLASALAGRGVEARVASPEGSRGSVKDFRRASVGVTSGLAGIASSGSVAVGPGVRNGGLLSALPAHHIVILDEEDIKPALGDVLNVFEERFEELGGEAVIITGPSRTADIEMMTVLGVHGPVKLDILITKAAE